MPAWLVLVLSEAVLVLVLDALRPERVEKIVLKPRLGECDLDTLRIVGIDYEHGYRPSA